MNYETHYLLEYLPKRYSASAEQIEDRKTVYSFKDGNCKDFLFDRIFSKVQEITKNPEEWIVCFIPASTKAKTMIRYIFLARRLEKKVGCKVVYEAISNKFDKEAGHIVGKSTNSIENFDFQKEKFKNKKVIVIDDVITRGRTFNAVANKILGLGAISVTGLFIAKTINPDWVDGSSSDYYCEDYFDNEDWESNLEMEAGYIPDEPYDDDCGQEDEYWLIQEDINSEFDRDPDYY